MNERDLLEGFERCTLPAASFHHADHVHVVWAYLREMPMRAALERFQTALKRFATHHGKPNLYHETITCAFVFLVNERMHRHADNDWESFCRNNPDLLTWKPSILDRYYLAETLHSELARRTFVFPDRVVG